MERCGLPQDGHEGRGKNGRGQEALDRFLGQEVTHGVDDRVDDLNDVGLHCDELKWRWKLKVTGLQSRKELYEEVATEDSYVCQGGSFNLKDS